MIDDTASVQYTIVRIAVAQLGAIADDMRKKSLHGLPALFISRVPPSITKAVPVRHSATHPDTFPSVREDNMKAYGRCRTRDLMLACMNTLEAGDTQTKVAV
jgi:hypothetical protein